MKEKFKNLGELVGRHSKVEENPKSLRKKEEVFFLELMEQLCQIEAVGAVLSTVGFQMNRYENPFYQSTKMLLEKYYGGVKSEIILWWVFDSISPEGGVYPLTDENEKQHIIKTPQQLFKFLKRYDRK